MKNQSNILIKNEIKCIDLSKGKGYNQAVAMSLILM